MSYLKKIDPDDLHEGRLLTPEQVEAAKHFFRDNPEGVKWSRKINDQTNFSVLCAEDGQMFALYTGKEKALGKGNFGLVKLAQNIETGEWVAIKLQKLGVDEKGISETEKEQREKEIERENEFLGRRGLFVASQRRANQDFSSKETHYSIMPVIEGRGCDEIQDRMEIEDTFYNLIDEDFSIVKIREEMLALSSFLVTVGTNIAHQLSEIHSDNIIHRDLRLANILATPEGQVTITDFGSAIELDPKTKTVTAEIAGERQTRPPEVVSASLQQKGKTFTYSEQQDLFSLGKCLENLKILSLIKEKSFQNLIGLSAEEEKRITGVLKTLLSDPRTGASQRASAEDVAGVLSEIQQKINKKIAENPQAIEETDVFKALMKLRENLPPEKAKEKSTYNRDDYDSSPGGYHP